VLGNFLAIRVWPWPDSGVPWLRLGIRYVSHHTGLPALVVAALFVVIGYRLLKKSARFAVEVAVISLVLFAATELGWLKW
jgi:hypothetical protein